MFGTILQWNQLELEISIWGALKIWIWFNSYRTYSDDLYFTLVQFRCKFLVLEKLFFLVIYPIFSRWYTLFYPWYCGWCLIVFIVVSLAREIASFINFFWITRFYLIFSIVLFFISLISAHYFFFFVLSLGSFCSSLFFTFFTWELKWIWDLSSFLI